MLADGGGALGETISSIRAAALSLRERQKTLAQQPLETVVAALAELGRCWREPSYALRAEAETWSEPFPFAMVKVSLDALLDSLMPDAIWALIEAENAQDTHGYPLISHVIAGNTPLLAWVSIIRALLVRSASLVKLPSNASAQWAWVFHRSLSEVAPDLAACIHLMSWPGGTADLDTALCAEADLVMAHGSDAALAALRAHCPPQTPLVGYGHRVSFGLLLPGADWDAAALGFAQDVLLYDQGGCLSPQTIYVVGSGNTAREFASRLAGALAVAAGRFPLPVRAEMAAGAVQDARALAWMSEGVEVRQSADQRWTVIARSESVFAPSPTFGVISVQPLASLDDLPGAVSAVASRLQGCAVAGMPTEGYLPGASYLCEPGRMQAPPLGWRQDGRDVLRVLLPPRV